MCKNVGKWIAILVTTAVACVAHAADEVTVQVWDGGSSPRTSVTFDSDEVINATNGLPTILSTDTRVNIYTSGGNYNIGRITFVANSRTSDLEVFLGTGAFPSQVPLTSVAVDWAGIAALPTNLVDKVKLAGAISGDLTNSLSVKQVFRLQVGDQVQAAVTATGTGTAIDRLFFASSTSSGTISASNGDIFEVRSSSTTTATAGAITAPNGSVVTVIATGAIAITASPGIGAKRGITSVQAASINADIVANAYSGDGDLGYISCDDNFAGTIRSYQLVGADPMTGDALHVAGDFTGTLDVQMLNGLINITGSVTPGSGLFFDQLCGLLHVAGDLPLLSIESRLGLLIPPFGHCPDQGGGYVYCGGDVGTVDCGGMSEDSGIFVEGHVDHMTLYDFRGTVAQGTPGGSHGFLDIGDS